MPELTFTQREIDELTELLGSLAAHLSESQGRLLMSIFAAGVDAVEQIPEGEAETPQEPVDSGTAPDSRQLSDRLRRSFKPDGPPPPRPLVIRVSP